jgi:hypothetical protein
MFHHGIETNSKSYIIVLFPCSYLCFISAFVQSRTPQGLASLMWDKSDVVALYFSRYTYLLTYLLTYSMEQSPSSEANWSAASQEIPRIL